MSHPSSLLKPQQKSMPRTEEHKKQSQEEQKGQKIKAFLVAVTQNVSSYDIPKVIENIAAEESKDTLFCSRDGLFARDIPESAQLLLAVAYIRVYGKFLFNFTMAGQLKFNFSIFKILVKQEYPNITSRLKPSYFSDIFLSDEKILLNMSNGQKIKDNYFGAFDIKPSPSKIDSSSKLNVEPYKKLDVRKLGLTYSGKNLYSSENIEKIALSLQLAFVENSRELENPRTDFFGFVREFQKNGQKNGDMLRENIYNLDPTHFSFLTALVRHKEVEKLFDIFGLYMFQGVLVEHL